MMRRAFRAVDAWLSTPHGGFWWNTVFAAVNAAFATDDSGLPSWLNLMVAVVLGLCAVRCALQERVNLHVNAMTLTFAERAGEGE